MFLATLSRRCVKYREALDRELPGVPRTDAGVREHLKRKIAPREDPDHANPPGLRVHRVAVISTSLAIVLMLRAVPPWAIGILSLDFPMPLA